MKKEELIHDGICGNCGNMLGDKDKYCQFCGTKRGEGDFLPNYNDTLVVYGPPVLYYYKCKKCNHKWNLQTIVGIDKSQYCPNCGSKKIKDINTNILKKFLSRLFIFIK